MRLPRYPWELWQEEWLCLHYGRFPMKFLTEHLKRSEAAVRIRIHRIRKESQRIEMLRNLRNIPCETAVTIG